MISIWILLLLGFFTNNANTQNNSQACVCVKYYLCDDENYIIADGGNMLLDPKFGLKVRMNNEEINADPCPEEEKCCRLRNPQLYLPQLPQNSSEQNNSQTSTNVVVTAKPFVPFDSNFADCGQGLNYIRPKIMSPESEEISLGEFPWLVAVLQNSLSTDGSEILKFVCWGSLVHPKVVLTATHCVKSLNKNYIKIKTGILKTEDVNANINVINQERSVSDIVEHKDYHTRALFNDISLLFLDSPFVVNEGVNNICLPYDTITYNFNCYAVGWHGTGVNKTVNRVELPLILNPTCQILLRKTVLGKYFTLHDSFICAGGEEGRDTCMGDGGGPLICQIANGSLNYVQVGIVSWGVGDSCGQINVPGMYTHVQKFTSWIRTEMQKKNIQ